MKKTKEQTIGTKAFDEKFWRHRKKVEAMTDEELEAAIAADPLPDDIDMEELKKGPKPDELDAIDMAKTGKDPTEF